MYPILFKSINDKANYYRSNEFKFVNGKIIYNKEIKITESYYNFTEQENNYINQTFGNLKLDSYTKFKNNKLKKYETHYQNNNPKEEISLDVFDGSEIYVDYLNNFLGPAYIEYYENGNKKLELYIIKDKLHRLNGPALIEYYESGNLKREEWYKNHPKKYLGLHNLEQPSILEWYENGQKKQEQWYKNNKLWRKNEPAVIEWYENGQKKEERYYKNGHLHRDTKGPRELIWDQLGNYIKI